MSAKDLSRYYCSRCGTPPLNSDEILKKGCHHCNNKLFRVNKEDQSPKKTNIETINVDKDDDATIIVNDRGIYEINVKGLLDNDRPLIVGAKGVYKVSLRS